ncbi:MAG: bifunctional 2-C-methyl-D-erythritol 4-phosphate cytidylyltransferase/2-C-methyl-D-erythritol 2,4-cyclodiphosphate synthase, partial [Sphingobium sp.]|nr:bifunctional 2-C-methyl-D-erythritol 4-phosphate cytidylyltransferase/2-C-methyl-D-erythritol 2,4-cyclodiphosphate synthase [Sphingobium sp.]
MNTKRIVALIVAAGSGTRLGSAIPKQFAPLAGKPMIAHSIAAFSSHPLITSLT